MPKKTIIKYAKKTGAIITAEEHEEFGGLGSAVSEIISKECPVAMEFIAIKDKFGQSGKSEELFEIYHLDEKSIINAVKKVIKRKR